MLSDRDIIRVRDAVTAGVLGDNEVLDKLAAMAAKVAVATQVASNVQHRRKVERHVTSGDAQESITNGRQQIEGWAKTLTVCVEVQTTQGISFDGLVYLKLDSGETFKILATAPPVSEFDVEGCASYEIFDYSAAGTAGDAVHVITTNRRK